MLNKQIEEARDSTVSCNFAEAQAEEIFQHLRKRYGNQTWDRAIDKEKTRGLVL